MKNKCKKCKANILPQRRQLIFTGLGFLLTLALIFSVFQRIDLSSYFGAQLLSPSRNLIIILLLVLAFGTDLYIAYDLSPKRVARKKRKCSKLNS